MQLDLLQHHENTAVLSECGRYRYELTRRWSQGPAVAWVMLNPSTADASVDDPTIRRCIGFAKREGFGALRVYNLFALRATDPSELARADDPVGPRNEEWLDQCGRNAHAIVVAWGAHTIAVDRVQPAIEVIGRSQLFCLGTTKSGAPRHPLYVRGDAELEAWSA